MSPDPGNSIPPDRPGASPTSIGSRWLSAWFIVPLMTVVVLGTRLPAISLGSELNPDESQMMAQAMRLGIDPVPWRGMDGTTSGPVNTWVLFLAHRLGMPLDYHWVHALAALILAAMSVLTYATLRPLAGRAVAAGGGAVVTVAIGLAQGANFTHFSSELVSALVSSAALLCVARALANPRLAPSLDPLCGGLLGILPWAKPQAAPGGVVLALWWALRIVRGASDVSQAVTTSRARRLLRFAGAAALPAVLVLGAVVAAGAWRDFWMSYVNANAAYAGGSTLFSMARKVFHLFESPPSALLAGLALFVAAWSWLRAPGLRPATGPLRGFLSAVTAFAAATMLAVLTPQYPLQHYQILLFAPVSLMSGCILGLWASADPSVGSRRYAGTLFAVCMLGIPMTAVVPAIRDARATLTLRSTIDRSPARVIARAIRTVSPGATTMAVWGWMPGFYVETGIPPATRHAICHFLIDPSPGRDFLRASFLSDIRTERPALIVDAVAAGCFLWRWDSTERLSSFPELDEYVRRNYVLAAEVDVGARDDPVRLYVSRAYLEGTGRPAPSLR